MTLALIKAQLKTEFEAVTGVSRAYEDHPDLAPSNPDCPAVILVRKEPFLSWSVAFSGSVDYTWHFTVLFLYRPLGLGLESEIDAGLEPFPARFVEKVVGNLTHASNTAATLPNENIVNYSGIEYNGKPYWGFAFDLDVTEQVTTTMAA